MIKILKNIVYFFYSFYSIFSFGKKNKAIALMYHSIADNNIFFSIKTKFFLKQIEYLVKHNYNIVSLSSLYKYLLDKKIPPRIITITFDDGYRDNYLNAYPILKKYNIPATIFINTSLIGTSVKARNGENLKMLNYNEITEMHKDGLIKFESHCHNHKELAKLDEKDVESELLLSKRVIKEKINYETEFLAYPFGSFNERVKILAKKYYKMAFSVDNGIINQNSDLFELKRNSIDSKVTFYQFKHIIKNGRI